MHQIKEEALDKQITIDGNFVKSYESITIHQSLHDHHTFEIIIDIDTIEEAGSYTLEKSKEWLGKQLTTNVSGKAFIGIILDISMNHDQIGLHSILKIKGLSQTVLLENGKQQKSWLEKDLKAIVSELVETTDIRNKIKPAFTATLAYQCQYGESSYKYIQRLAHQYNEWFYFNGVDLIFGKPESDDQSPIELEYNRDLEELQVLANTFNPALATYSYDALKDEYVEGELKATNDGMNSLGNTALKASEDIYKENKDFSVSDVFLQDKSSLDEYLEKRLQGVSAQGNVLRGKGGKKGLQLGAVVKISAAKYEQGEYEVKQYGDYIITQISHYAGTGGAYYNTFEAIPASSKNLPTIKSIKPLQVSNQIATVVSNADPESKGRVQVQFHWQKADGLKTDFIRVMTPDAGSSELTETNRGFVFIPEEGDQVMVGFEYGDPNRPFILGSMFTGKTGAGGGDQNIKKSLVTRGGHTIELDDTEGEEKITIKDKDGSTIIFDTKEKSLYVQSVETMEFSAKNIVLNAEENISLNAKENVEVSTEADTILIAKGELNLQSDGATSVKSKDKLAMEATSDATLKGSSAIVEGQSSAELNGAQTKVTGSGMTEVSGGVVKIN